MQPHTPREYDLELEKYKKILDNMTESVWMGNENEETIYANPNFCTLIGSTLEELIGRKSYDFWDEESIKMVQKNNKLRKDGVASKYEWVLKAKDGTRIPVFLSGTPIPGGWTVGIMTDMREIKSLQKVEEDLKRLNKTKDEFISIVGHELRTPLTAIKGYLSMILDGDFGTINDAIKKSLMHSYESTNRLVELVNDMLSISKIESGKMTYYVDNFRAVPILKAVYQDLIIEAELRRLTLILDIEQGVEDIVISVDENKLKQVLINLATNALKFTQEGGCVTLKLARTDNALLFSVIDTGEGIPSDKVDTLFEKFTQVEGVLQRKNTSWLGLGLAIAREFINKFWGTISVESEIGKGSNFYFSLPVVHG